MNSTEADVVVIGSGFGGSISANRLALVGLRVSVLERGPWRDLLPVRSMGIARRAPFPYGMKAVTHLLRTVHFGGLGLTLKKSGLFEVFSYPGLRVLVVSAVGGGSHGPYRVGKPSALATGDGSRYRPRSCRSISPPGMGSNPDAAPSNSDLDTAIRHGGRQMSPRRLAAPRRDQAPYSESEVGSNRRGRGRPSPDVRV